MLKVILWVFGYAKSIAGIEIEIRATEAATKAKEATWRLQCVNIRMYFHFIGAHVICLFMSYWVCQVDFCNQKLRFKQWRPPQRLWRPPKNSISD